jgi:hypothetical protein
MNIEADFWNQFLPGFIASIISGLIFTVLIGLFLYYVRKPRLKICLSIGTGVKGHSLMFYAVNTGRVGLMPHEMQWNIYFPLALRPRENFNERCSSVTLKMQPYNNVMGFNEKAILPGDSLLLTSVPVDKNEKLAEYLESFEWIDEAKYYYSLTTVRGQKKYVKFFWDYFKKTKYLEDSSFIKRPIFEIIEKKL